MSCPRCRGQGRVSILGRQPRTDNVPRKHVISRQCPKCAGLGNANNEQRRRWLATLYAGTYLFDLPDEAREDREVVRAAVTRFARNLKYAGDRLKADKEVVLAAVRQDGMVLESAAPGPRGDRDVVLAAVVRAGAALEFASSALRGDKEIVLAAITSDGFALQFASSDLQRDKEVVATAVAQYGPALRHAAEDLRGDPDVALTAMTQDCAALKFASPRLLADRAFLLRALATNGRALRFAEDKLRGDAELAEVAVTQTGFALEFVGEELLSDHSLVTKAVGHAGRALRFAAPLLQTDRAIVMAAVQADGRALAFAAEHIRADEGVVRTALAQDPRALEFVSETLRVDEAILAQVAARQMIQTPGDQEAAQARWDAALEGRHLCELPYRELRELVDIGVPLKHRLALWPVWLGINDEDSGDGVEALDPAKLEAQCAEDIARQVELDVPRTHPKLLDDAARAMLRRLLCAYAVLNPEVGYCQGLNYMAVIFVLLGFPERVALCGFKCLIDRLCPQYHVPGFAGYLRDAAVSHALAQRALSDVTFGRLSAVGVPLNVLATDHFLSLGARHWPVAATVQLWDFALLEGPPVIFAALLALLELYLPEEREGEDLGLDPVDEFRRDSKRGVTEDLPRVLHEVRRLIPVLTPVIEELGGSCTSYDSVKSRSYS